VKEVVLITGVTGFLGSHLGKFLSEQNYFVIGTRRDASNLKNCIEFSDRITWLNIDEDNWKEKAIGWKPKIIIHAAWGGVKALERDNWELQVKNLNFLQDLLYIAENSSTQKFLGLGSQAEYELTDKIIKESHHLSPTNAYGAMKIVASQLIKYYCELHSMPWYWLRVFSVFGEKEDEKWLLPSVIKKLSSKENRKMEFSTGEQQYAYLYIKDLVNAIMRVVATNENRSGIYNISGTNPLPLKMLLTLIKDKINPDFELEFGSLPYRKNQSMVIAGDMSLFNQVFGSFQTTNLEESLNSIIEYYTSKELNESI
jgi:nucleoside-diphosphate-sugar epimerase